ncbi:hypothetical protein BCR34DRAFT_590051 [Clohesyomyces aquaticus]|uniref:Uncharacterized protein n=1 Tax=Clohesyomyces aquaticus TaxID=1231657 RepID=A0A1Y1ZDE6_9PLEO|nr:hypothetical protein BCR34DRAFT_590051 [Clohesyomyces aquaticus]
MDIRRWLAETVLPERLPSLPEQLGLPPFLQPKEQTEQRRQKGNRRRKRGTSDSSLLDHRPIGKKAPPINYETNIDEGTDAGPCSDATSASSSSGSSKSSHKYARRPRRKTRLERYEHAAKEIDGRGKEAHLNRKGESRKRRRQSRHKQRGQPRAGLVQGFTAKNVPTDRLTLKPREKLGIFSKGRASSPVKGRGLPDLVFSEMKFLQKHKSQPEVVPQAGVEKRKRRKDHARARQEEISAYFTSVGPVLAEKDGNIQAKGGSHHRKALPNPDHERQRPRPRSLLFDNAIPTVELGDKGTYLGFRSRGPRHRSGSYISWSESVRGPSVTPIYPRAGSTIDVGQLAPIPNSRDRNRTGVTDVLYSRNASSSISRRVTEGSGQHFEVSSLTPAIHRETRSHSFPLRVSSPRALDVQGRKGQTTDIAASPTSMPSALPRHPQIGGQETRGPHVDGCGSGAKRTTTQLPKDPECEPNVHGVSHEGEHLEEGSDKAEPQSSSSLANILRECNAAFDGDRRRVAGSYGCYPLYIEPVLEEREETDPPSDDNPQRRPTVRFSGVEMHHLNIPNFLGPGIYEEQAERLRAMERRQYDTIHKVEDSLYKEKDEWMDDEEEEEDNGEELLCGEGMELLPEEMTSQVAGAEAEWFVPGLITHGERLEQRDNTVTRDFWRPNRLY